MSPRPPATEEMDRIHALLPKELVRKAKVIAVASGRTLTELLRDGLEAQVDAATAELEVVIERHKAEGKRSTALEFFEVVRQEIQVKS